MAAHDIIMSAAGGSTAANYIEDVFSTYLYTGTGASQTITNGIDLAGKGGLVWQKRRSSAQSNTLVDTVRGGSSYLISDTTAAAGTGTAWLTFGSTGFSTNNTFENTVSETYASWTFRKQPKFFDVVTYTGTGSAQNIAHSLGSVPGCIVIKGTTNAASWCVYHTSVGAGNFLTLETTSAATASSTIWNNTSPTASVFTVGTGAGVNTNGATYVAYIFAHNAGGFGLTGNDNVISCGSFNNASPPVQVNVGFEPQWLLVKNTTTAQGWFLFDNMRPWTADGNYSLLQPNTSGAEVSGSGTVAVNSTGFSWLTTGGDTFIYIAIRRGPMRVPTDATKVFSPLARAGSSTAVSITSPGFPPDMLLALQRSSGGQEIFDKLRGNAPYLITSSTSAEANAAANSITQYTNQGVDFGADSSTGYVNMSGLSYAHMFFQRAPSFFDEVCYTGTGVARTITHNLTTVPQLSIFKCRTDDGVNHQNWVVGTTLSPNADNSLLLNSTAGYPGTNPDYFNNTRPTSTVVTIGADAGTNAAGFNYVAYLFASCPGVSKVGSYTGGNGANLLTYSEQFDNAIWSKPGMLAFGSGSTVNATTAPDGLLTADLLTESTANANHYAENSGITRDATLDSTFSIYLKPNGRNDIVVTIYDWVATTNNLSIRVNIATGAVTTAASASGSAVVKTSSITSAGNGWYRVVLGGKIGPSTGGTIRPRIQFINGSTTYTGDGASGVYAWGAQFEAGTSATTYVPTFGATSKLIDCGFAAGARFVLIKRTDAAGDWYVWDTARGIISGNDPHLSLNTTAAEVSTDDTIIPDSRGFIVNQLAATNVNVNAASYLFLAIA